MKKVFPAAMALLLLGGFFLGFSGSVDDAHITFHAARVFGEQGEILNYNGERVEQSSALLQVILLGLLHALSGFSVVILGHVTTLVAAVLALPAVAVAARRVQPGSESATLVLLATAPFFVYWSCSGMEAPLLALLLLWLLMAADNFLRSGISLPWLAVLSLAAQMARPEMPIVLPAFAVSLLVLRVLRKMQVWSWHALGALLLVQLLCAALLTGWRWHYFSALAPQPVSAKVGGTLLASLPHGLQYAQQTLFDWRLLLPTLLAITGTVFVWRQRQPFVVLIAVFAWLYAAFIVLSGGDWMAAGRFWVPVMPLFAVLATVAVHSVFTRPWLQHAVLAVAVAGNVSYLWRGTAVDFNGVPLWKKTKLADSDRAADYSFFERHAREHVHDIPTLAFVRPLLHRLSATQPTGQPLVVMAGQMGMVPYYLANEFGAQLRFQDRNGITERTLTHCPAAAGLLRTRNGIGTGYEWLVANSDSLARDCGFVLPDIVFDIETGWNRKNTVALENAGYVFVYRQRGHIVNESAGEWLPLRVIGAGQYIAVSQAMWERLGRPAPVERAF